MRDFAKWENTKRGAIWAFFVTMLYIPAQIYFVKYMKPEYLENIRERNINVTQLWMLYILTVFIVLFICSVFGFAWAKKYGTKGFGTPFNLRMGTKTICIVGVFSGLAYYFFYTKHVHQTTPELFPKSILAALLFVFSGSVFEETLFRFGLFSWWLRIIGGRKNTKKKFIIALIAATIFCSLISVIRISFVHHDFATSLFVSLFILELIFNFTQNIIFSKYGLIACICVHMIMYLRILFLV